MPTTAQKLHHAIDLQIMRLADLKGRIAGITGYTMQDEAESALLLRDLCHELHRANSAAMVEFAWEAAQCGGSHLSSSDILNLTDTEALEEALAAAKAWADAILERKAA